MVHLIPPPEGVQDRNVYDYLYQLQEYLGTVLGAVRPAEKNESTPAEDDEDVIRTRALINKTAKDLREETKKAVRDLIEKLTDYLRKEEAGALYLSQTDFRAYTAEVAQTIAGLAGIYLSQTDFRAYTAEVAQTIAGLAGIYLSQTAFNAFRTQLLETLAALETDYVLETGAADGWRWRKWSGGEVELWGRWEWQAGETPGTQAVVWPAGIVGEMASVSAGNPDPAGTAVEVRNIVPGTGGVRFELTAGADPALPAVVVTVTAYGREEQGT